MKVISKTIVVKSLNERDTLDSISENVFVYVVFFGWYYFKKDRWIFIDDRRLFNE